MGETMKDFTDLLKSLEKNKPSNEYVMITGQQGYENFNFGMMGIDVHISVNNKRYQFGRVRHLWVFNLYEKHGPYKITLNCKTKKFKAYYGTTLLGETYSAESAFKLHIKKHKDGI
jgi:hypothetical protein